MVNERRGPRHEWLRPAPLALVFVGGLAGAVARDAVTAAFPPGAAFPVGILATNLLGALLLGALLEALADPSGRVGSRQAGSRRAAQERLRLLLGTGLLGGFTTYSSLALAVVALAHEGSPALGVAYGLGTLVLGAVATFLGVALASFLRGRVRVSPAPAAGAPGSGETDA